MKKAMKRLGAIIISMALIVSLTPVTGMAVYADETDSGTQAASDGSDAAKPKEEKPDSEKHKESKKQASDKPKETEKKVEETTKETEKPKAETPKETQKPTAETSKETEKPAETTKETEKPVAETSKETEAPKETEKPATEAPKETEPKETEAPKETADTPKESGETAAETTKETETTETEVPKETETSKEPENSETETPEETEVTEETEPSETEESQLPEDPITADPKNGTVNYSIKNAQISSNGILTWTASEGVPYYEVWIEGEWVFDWYASEDIPASYDLKKEIDRRIKNGQLDNGSSYVIMLAACSEEWEHMDEWTDTLTYKSTVTPIDFEIKNAQISNDGILTWTATEGVKYELWVDGEWLCDWDADNPASFDLKKEIDKGIRNNKLDNSDSYEIMLAASNDESTHMDEWTRSFAYISSVTPVVVEDISNVTLSNGILTWDSVSGAATYGVAIDCFGEDEVTTNSYDLGREIDRMIKNGTLLNNGSYYVVITAYDSENVRIAEWHGYKEYSSNAEPIQVGTINASISNGILTWNAYSGTYVYEVEISGQVGISIDNETTSCDLKKEIDRLIKSGDLDKENDNTYEICLRAYDEDTVTLAKWTGSFEYNSSAAPIEKGTIAGVTINNGVMTWNPYAGAEGYMVSVNNWTNWVTGTSFELNDYIDDCIKEGYIDKGSPYEVSIEAYDSDEVVIADYSEDYEYASSAEPFERGDVNAVITNGILTWDAYEGAAYYDVYIGNQLVTASSRSVDLNKAIADMIAAGELESASTYLVEIYACDNNDEWIASWSQEYTYTQSTETSISSATVTGISDKVYTGSAITQSPVVTLGGKTLTENTDYTVAYSNNTNVGTATVTITGAGDYTGTLSKTFKISAADISGATITGIEEKTYTGSAITQSFVVNVGGNVLEAGTDYTVAYSDNINAGTATLTLTGKGNYSGTVSKAFIIVPDDITTATFSGIEDKSYTGSAISQALVVTKNGKTLVENTDYTVVYEDNINVGTASVTITAKGNYSGVVCKVFEIKAVDISVATVTGIEDKPYTGSAITQNIVVTIGAKTLVADTDYTVTYADNTEVGTATVTIQGIGNYKETITKTFEIFEIIDISGATVADIEDQSYNGKAITPELVVTIDGTTLEKDTDYTVTYSNNKVVGTAGYTITGIGGYTGTISGTFTIVKADNTLNVSGKVAKVKRKTKKQKIKATKVYKFISKGQGKLKFLKLKGSSKKLSINAKTGVVTVKGKTKKGTYKAKVKITAAGNANVNASNAKVVVITVKVR